MKSVLLASIFALAALTASASSVIYLGFEDSPTGDRDYNDVMASITGSTLHTSTGVFTVLTPAIVNADSGNPFWDHVSGDGPNMNIGNFWESEEGIEYLATAGGGKVSDVWFSGGSTVTITGGITADHDTIGVCYVSNCAGTTQWITGPSLTFAATGNFEIVGKNGSPGVEFYSDPSWNESSSFAFAQGTQTPEPNAAVGLGLGLALILTARARHWRHRA